MSGTQYFSKSFATAKEPAPDVHPVSAQLKQTMESIELFLNQAVRRLIENGTLPRSHDWPATPIVIKPRRWSKKPVHGHVFTSSLISEATRYNHALAGTVPHAPKLPQQPHSGADADVEMGNAGVKAAAPSSSSSSTSAGSSEEKKDAKAMDWALLVEAECKKDWGLLEICDFHVAPPGFINFTLKDKNVTQRSSRGEREPTKVDATQDPQAFHAVPIGYFESCFKEKHGTPRQGAVASAARGCLQLRGEVGAEALDGIEEYSHVWLIFVFHANTNLHKDTTFKAKIKPPRLKGVKTGVFATRSPHRVNPIGLSVAKLEKRVNDTLFFSGVDLIDGTPVLDIKPYHPADCVPNFRQPQWMETAPPALLQVIWTQSAAQQLRDAVPKLRFFDTYEQIEAAISQSLSQDPRTLASKKKWKNGLWAFMIDHIEVAFRVYESHEQYRVLSTEPRESKSTSSSVSSSSSLATPSPSFATPTPLPASSISSSSSSSSSSAVPLPSPSPPAEGAGLNGVCEVVRVVYHAPDAVKPKLRSETWHKSIQEQLGINGASSSSSSSSSAAALSSSSSSSQPRGGGGNEGMEQ